MEEEKTLENLEVGETGESSENETLQNEDNSHTDKVERYKQQMEGSKAEAKRLHDMMLERETARASKDASSLLELHDLDPRLADEVAKQFGYENFEDAKPSIAEKVGSGVQKTKEADFQENFDKYYQERKAKETHEEALQRAEKLLGKIKDEKVREKAQKQFERITAGRQLTIDEAEEFVDMATLRVNKDSLKSEKYDEGLVNYASTGMGMGKKATADDKEEYIVRDGRLVLLNSNGQQ